MMVWGTRGTHPLATVVLQLPLSSSQPLPTTPAALLVTPCCLYSYAVGAVLLQVLRGEECAPYLSEEEVCCADLHTLAALIFSRTLRWPQEVVALTHKATRHLVELLLCQDAYQRPSLDQVCGWNRGAPQLMGPAGP